MQFSNRIYTDRRKKWRSMDEHPSIFQHLHKLSTQLENDDAFFDCLPRRQANCSTKKILHFLEHDSHLLFKRAFCFEVRDQMHAWARSYGVHCKTLCVVRRLKHSPRAVLFEILITLAQGDNDLYPTHRYYISLSTFHLEKTIGHSGNYALLAKQPRLAEFEGCFAERYEEKIYPEWLQKMINALPHRAQWHANRNAVRRLKEIEKNMLWQIQQNFSTFYNEADS